MSVVMEGEGEETPAAEPPDSLTDEEEEGEEDPPPTPPVREGRPPDMEEADEGEAEGEEGVVAEARVRTETSGSPQRVQRLPFPKVPHLGQTKSSAPHWSQKWLSDSISA